MLVDGSRVFFTHLPLCSTNTARVYVNVMVLRYELNLCSHTQCRMHKLSHDDNMESNTTVCMARDSPFFFFFDTTTLSAAARNIPTILRWEGIYAFGCKYGITEHPLQKNHVGIERILVEI